MEVAVVGRDCASRIEWLQFAAHRVGAGALLTIAYAFGPGASSTSPLVFLTLPIGLWVSIVVLLAIVKMLDEGSPVQGIPTSTGFPPRA